MAAEIIGSSVGSPRPSPSPYPTSLLWEEKKCSPNAPASSPNRVLFPKCPQYPQFPCKVCGDPCVVRTSHTERNPNRDFYTCASGMKCNMFQWCDEVGKIRPRGVNSLPKQNSPVKPNSPMKPGLQRDVASSQNPICICGAGPCRVETKQNGVFKGRKYFACHLKKGQGLCTHFEWCDDRGETKGKDVIIPDEMVVPNLVEGSPSKRKRVEGWLNECIASPTLGCYINEKQPMDCKNSPWISPVKESPPALQIEPQVECSPINRPSLSSPMKRLSLTEGSSLGNPERCAVCGEVGHGFNECPSKRNRVEGWLNECITSPTLGCYINEQQPLDRENSQRISPVEESPPPLQIEPHVEFSPTKRPSLSSPMKRLSEFGISSPTEGGSSGNPERCAVCGEVGHGVNECASLVIW